MQHDSVVTYFIIGIYVFVAWLIIYQIEIRLRLYARLRCRFGKHKRELVELGKHVRTYRCIYCGRAKSHPHLQVIDGGKKDLGSKFRW